MKPARPLSYQFGDLTVRQDAGSSKTWRVFAASVEMERGTLGDCIAYVRRVAPQTIRSAWEVLQ